MKFYGEAQNLGQRRRAEAIQKIHEGIACFDTLAEAKRDAEENIRQFTKSDFVMAHFYELVKKEASLLMRNEANSISTNDRADHAD